MSTWNQRLLPHPLLASWSDDYPGKTFETLVPHAVLNNGKQISFTVKHHLTSTYLASFIEGGCAEYVTILTCPRTAYRKAFRTNQTDDVYVVSAGDYSREAVLETFVVAAEDREDFISSEHAEEFSRFRPDGFSVSCGAILAAATPKRIELEEGGSPFSIVDLVSTPAIDQRGLFSLDYGEERIKIYVSPEDKARIEAIRRRGPTSVKRATLFPALYLHAIVEALRVLDSYPDSRWAYTITAALTKQGLSCDPEETRENAIEYGQRIMERPIELFLTALLGTEGE